MIHNVFFIPGKVPSMNELLRFKANSGPAMTSIIRRTGQKKGQFRFNLYNETKRDWSSRVLKAVKSAPNSVRVKSAHFSYLVIEKNQRRDPSNICSSAVKFIEDGLQKAGVIPDDGWKQVLGISTYWGIYDGHDHGVYVVMSDKEMRKEDVEQVCWQERRMNGD